MHENKWNYTINADLDFMRSAHKIHLFWLSVLDWGGGVKSHVKSKERELNVNWTGVLWTEAKICPRKLNIS